MLLVGFLLPLPCPSAEICFRITMRTIRHRFPSITQRSIQWLCCPADLTGVYAMPPVVQTDQLAEFADRTAVYADRKAVYEDRTADQTDRIIVGAVPTAFRAVRTAVHARQTAVRARCTADHGHRPANMYSRLNK